MNEYYISRETESEEDIEHYGVVGMKWGHRKQARQLTHILRKEQKSAAKNIGTSVAYQGFADKYKHKYEKAVSKDHTKRASRWKNRQTKYQNKADASFTKFKASQKSIENSKKLVNKYSDMMITYGRTGSGSAYGTGTVNGGLLRVDYSKAKIRENNAKNQKRYAYEQVDRGYRFVEEFWNMYPM